MDHQKRSAIANTNLQKKEQKSIEKYLDRIAPLEKSVYSDDKVLDADYAPQPKRAKLIGEKKPRKSKKAIADPKQRILTPKERIERLKRKISGKKVLIHG